MKFVGPSFIFLVLLVDPANCTSRTYSGQKQGKYMQKQGVNPTIEKRIVLHSQTDLLAVIANLSNEVKELNNSFSSLQSNLLKQEAEIRSLKKDNLKLLSDRKGGGSTYVRWGKKTCPSVNGTALVYSGYAGGSLYSDSGAAANLLCLSPDPLWEHFTDASDALAHIYGVEYQFSSNTADIPRHIPFFGKRLDEQDVPCSVCEAPRSNVLMIPGRNACYKGWTLEYSGYLVAGYYGFSAASEYICLDKHPEFIVGGSRNDNGALLYFVEAVCGSLECPPYVNGRELTCAVCSK